jgi:hypothetical protein
MPDMGALAAALASLNAAKDIAQAMIGLRDAAAFQGKLIEFQGKIIEANNAAFAAQEERSALLEQIRALEKEVADLKAWETEKQRYQMEEVWPGATAYVLKKEAQGTEPIHWLCVRCYHEGKKGVLQLGTKTADQAGRLKGWECSVCKSNIFVRYDISPGKVATF